MEETEEPDIILPKALDVYEDISGYNPEESPSNGFEYLHQVICENSKLPSTMVAGMNLEKYKVNQTCYINEYKDPSVKHDFLPTQEWQQFQIMIFIDLRNNVSYMKEVWSNKKLSNNSNSMPGDISHERSWLEFCKHSSPSLGHIFSIEQAGVIKLQNYFSLWLADGDITFSPNTCLWLYSIFAILEEPLWPTTFGDLRDILKMAREKRSHVESIEDSLLVPLNLIICVGARHFRQSDLCD